MAQAQSGYIGQACLQANRPASSRSLCACIDRVARTSLTFSEQKRGATFFEDPHAAQVLRQSDKARDVAFWENWKAFGEKAARACD